MILTLATVLGLMGCGGKDADDSASAVVDTTRPWNGGLERSDAVWPERRGLVSLRSIIHLHSPWSHDACDGDGLPDGQVNQPCLDDLRYALCKDAIDVAFLTDHPSHAAEQDYDTMLLAQPGDTLVDEGQGPIGVRIDCEGGGSSLWLPGFEDDLMPVAINQHVPGDAEERDRLYNAGTEEGMTALLAAGATVLHAHTEGKDLDVLKQKQDWGLNGVELFNLHAMFGPDIREEDLGLDPFGWAEAATPFTSPDGTAEPDLLFLAVLQDQPPSLEKWDALLARGPMIGTAGTDAHQNTIPLDLRDGERGDSYRRMLRWFSNVILAEGTDPSQVEAGLAAGRLYVAFEALGTPVGFDFYLTDTSGAVHEMGSASGLGTLTLACPTLSADSPQGAEQPAVSAQIMKDGAVWAESCGDHQVTEPGVYRVHVDSVPHHLRPFLGEEPDVWMKPLPWVRSNAIRVSDGR